MRVKGLGRSLLFGIFAALSWYPAALVLVPRVGASQALSLHAGIMISLYVMVLSSSRARGLRLALLFLASALAAHVVAPSLGVSLVLMGVALATCRSGFVYRQRPARALLLELSLVGGGLLLARWVGQGTGSSQVLGIWTFFLVQSAFFVACAVSPREAELQKGDPFEEARSRLLRNLEGL